MLLPYAPAAHAAILDAMERELSPAALRVMGKAERHARSVGYLMGCTRRPHNPCEPATLALFGQDR